MLGFIKRFLGDNNDKEIARYRKVVEKINALEPQMQALTDDKLTGYTNKFRERLANGETLDDILPEAFAVVREGSRRVLGMRHFDVQLIGGMCLHEGKIAEMRTGEGKTLVATLPVYLNALTGEGVHMVTVNDYLARRDSEDMGRLYRYLGLTVGLVVHDMDFPERKFAYSRDVTFGTNNEFGFDYLRDNMVIYPEQMVQRKLHYAIVDEVDSILIDEARTPLIISGPGAKSTDMYAVMAKAVAGLKEGIDYTVDEKQKTVAPADNTIPKVERILGINNLYAPENIELSHCFTAALRAKALMKRDRDYVVRNGEIIIVDEFTGRLMEGRRYSDGLHQAIEAKEGVKIQRESQTLATITFQNYFRMYDKLGGMTGTAKTEEDEFLKIYNLPVIVVPTNKPVIRKDYPDLIFKTKRAKYKAVGRAVTSLHAKGQPVLIGTTSITQSEELSAILKKNGIPHNVLNAKFHEKEAEIIAGAGQKGAVTIATNMAGRGTDIKLGEGVPELGGLFIIGTERHESRRIDNQLRGRAGRQGDPGASRFYLSLEDDLMRLFGGDRVSGLMNTLKIDEDTPIENRMITNTLESAQKKLEGRNFEIRKNVLKYDDVMNQQREIIYGQRRKVLDGEDISTEMHKMLRENIDSSCAQFLSGDVKDEWDFGALRRHYQGWLTTDADFRYTVADFDNISREGIADMLYNRGMQILQAKEVRYGAPLMRELERICLLKCVDRQWMDHIDNMDQLRQGIALRGYGQKDPVVEYRIEGFDMFDQMVDSIREDSVKMLLTIEIRQAGAAPKREQVAKPTGEGFVPGNGAPGVKGAPKGQPVRVIKIGRNDPCPCGSGLKWKKCTCAKFHPEGLPTDANED